MGETEESALSSQFTDAVSKSNMEVEELTLLTSEIPEDAGRYCNHGSDVRLL